VARVDPGGPATPAGRATPVGLEDPATPVGLVDPAGRVTVVDPGDMNRVAAATVGTAAAMAPADLASRAVPVVRVATTSDRGPTTPSGASEVPRGAMEPRLGAGALRPEQAGAARSLFRGQYLNADRLAVSVHGQSVPC